MSDFAVPRGTVLEVDDDSYTVDDCVPSVGGFGSVYRISRAGDGEPFAAKFMLDADVKGQSRKLAAEIKRKTLQRFDNEIARLEEMEEFGEDRPFPRCFGRGVWQGHPFYVMELLEKVNLYEIQTEEERRRFVSALCDAVSFLHGRGYVHYDIKPSNILKRCSVSYGRACVTYVLADFGSVHKVEQHQRTDQGETLMAFTVSRLSDGRRMRVGTPGYADPVDDLHTVHADIYAIGQVIRDMFQESVPILWATIINKCTSRNYNYRYQTAAEISRALADIVFQGPKMLQEAYASVMAWAPEQRELFVSCQAAKDGDGTKLRPYKCISDAINSAESGTCIFVGPGIYREVLVLKGKKVDLIGEDGPARTIIQGKKRKSVICILQGADSSTIKGFTITGGTGSPQKSSYGFDYYGGGIKAEVSAHIEDCVIVGNGSGVPKKSSCTFGGAVFAAARATVSMNNCRIRNNFAWACGGGLMAAGEGAGFVVERCTIQENDATDFFGRQGGVGLSDGAILTVTESILSGNSGSQIGAFGNDYARGTRAQVDRSYIEGGVNAGGILMFIPGRNNFTRRPDSGCGCDATIDSSLV